MIIFNLNERKRREQDQDKPWILTVSFSCLVKSNHYDSKCKMTSCRFAGFFKLITCYYLFVKFSMKTVRAYVV